MQIFVVRILSFLLIFVLLGQGTGFSFIPSSLAADDAEDIQKDISSIEKKLKAAEAKQDALEKELSSIGSSLSTTQRAIAAAEIKIRQAENEIDRKRAEIELLEEQTGKQKHLLSGLLQDLALEEDTPLPRVLLASADFTEYVNQPERLLTVQEKIAGLLDTLQETKSVTESERAKLEGIKEDHQELLEEKVEQKQELAEAHQETASDLAEQNATINDLQKKLNKLKDNLSDLLGSSYDAKDVEDAASFASKKTGVRKDFIMGMLVVESDLGRYTGGCTYEEVEKGAEARYKAKKLSKTSWATFQRRREIFKDIADELGKNYKKLKVSCNPAGYTGTGGAMGVPQFMPDTWLGYKKSIASATGHNPPNPWNLTDGVMAMALKLAKVPGVTSGNKTAEKNASKIYLSGTTSSKYNWYADKVQYWANNYERLLD